MCIRDRNNTKAHGSISSAVQPSRAGDEKIGRMFRAYCHAKHSEWPVYMKKVEDWLNSTTHESTGFTPHELIKGTRPPRILEQIFDYPPANQTIDVNVKIQLANESLLTKGEKRKQRHDTNCLLYTSRCV